MSNLFYLFDCGMGYLSSLLTKGVLLLRKLPTRSVFSPLRESDVLYIFERLSLLLEAGMPLGTSLAIVEEQSLTAAQKRYVTHLHQNVMQGYQLSQIQDSDNVMPATFKTLIAIGEQTGTLAVQMKTGVVELHQSHQARQRLMATLLYPSILFITTISIVIFLLLVIFPKITPIFTTFETELPWSTRFLMSMSQFVSTYGFWLLAVLILGCVIITFSYQRSIRFARIWILFLMRLPIFGRIIRTHNLTETSRIASVLFSSGIRASESMYLVARHVKNPLYQQALVSTATQVESGRKLSSGLVEHPLLFPRDMVSLLAVAESTGTVPKTFTLLAMLYAHELETYQRRLVALIEPILMIVMGLAIGFIAVSIITPLYGLTNVLSV